MKQNIQTVTCPFHGLNLRPDVCTECSRITPLVIEERLPLEVTDGDRVELAIVIGNQSVPTRVVRRS